MPTCLGSGLLPKLYSEFLPRYPGVVLDAHTSETCVDIVAGGYDVAIRVAQRLTDSTLTARRLATSPLVRRRAIVSAGARHTVASGGAGPASVSRLTAREAAERGWYFRAGNERFSVPIDFWAASVPICVARAACSGLGFVYLRSESSPTSCSTARCRSLPEFCRASKRGSMPCTPAARRPRTRQRSSISCATLADVRRHRVRALPRLDRWRLPTSGK